MGWKKLSFRAREVRTRNSAARFAHPSGFRVPAAHVLNQQCAGAGPLPTARCEPQLQYIEKLLRTNIRPGYILDDGIGAKAVLVR
jgi:hypothetical protein